jgi:two-component system NarL family sensor kinase
MTEQAKHGGRTSELRRRNRELSILNIIASALNGSVDLSEALRVTLGQVAELLDLGTGWVWLLDETSGEARLAASQNLPPALARNPRRMTGWCYCLDTFRTGDLSGAANVNVVTCTRLKGLVDGTNGLRYHASIPLYAHGKKLGVMNLASPDWRELSPDDLRLLHTIGDFLSIAIERARLFAQSAEIGKVEERNRLAREIHDTLAQGMAGVALQLETADALLESEADLARVRDAVRAALSLTRENLEEARRSVLDLRAAPLEGRTLAEALAALADEWSQRGQIPIRFDRLVTTVIPRNARKPSARIEEGLYRISQEALANLVQHAQATRGSLLLTESEDGLMLTITDNGRGFDAEHLPPGHFGLIGMRERARLLGGTLEMESGRRKGTRITVRLPLEAHP